MQNPKRRPRLGNVFIAIGVLLILAIGGAWGWEQWQGKQLRDRLAAEATAQAQQAAAVPPTAVLAQAPEPTAVQASTKSEATTTVAPTQAPLVAASPEPASAAAVAPSAVPGARPVHLLISDLKIDTPVSDMTWTVVNTPSGPQSEWEIPDNAAGHAVNSALLGQPDNVVISGHNNIAGRVFLPISRAWPETGVQKVDEFTDRSDILNGHKVEILGADGKTYSYNIVAFYRVKDSGVPVGQRLVNARFMDPTNQATLTLTTCWPPWSNTHRLIVIAEPAS